MSAGFVAAVLVGLASLFYTGYATDARAEFVNAVFVYWQFPLWLLAVGIFVIVGMAIGRLNVAEADRRVAIARAEAETEADLLWDQIYLHRQIMGLLSAPDRGVTITFCTAVPSNETAISVQVGAGRIMVLCSDTHRPYAAPQLIGGKPVHPTAVGEDTLLYDHIDGRHILELRNHLEAYLANTPDGEIGDPE